MDEERTTGAGGSAWTVVRDAAIVAVACTAIGFLANALRSDGIPFMADDAWFTERLYQPCPMPGGDIAVEGLDADDARAQSPRTLWIDVRPPEAFSEWHADGALNLPHDPLTEPTPEEVQRIAREVAASGRAQVLVYSTGDYPDGKDFARLLVKNGIHNVYYITGGDAALIGWATATQTPDRQGEGPAEGAAPGAGSGAPGGPR